MKIILHFKTRTEDNNIVTNTKLFYCEIYLYIALIEKFWQSHK